MSKFSILTVLSGLNVNLASEYPQFACEFEAYKIERHLGWFIIGLAGIISNIIAMPILKALATITEAAFIYKSKHKQN